LGFEPRKDEVKKLMSDNDKENTGTINKAQFVEIFKAKWVSMHKQVTDVFKFQDCFISVHSVLS
jgi:Ca2+-binding EF-hand superfamily protein